MNVEIYTDGAARGNPDGPGGYGVVLHYTDTQGNLHEKELSQGYVRTTNNRMELMAAIAGLEALKTPCTSLCIQIPNILSMHLTRTGLTAGSAKDGNEAKMSRLKIPICGNGFLKPKKTITLHLYGSKVITVIRLMRGVMNSPQPLPTALI